mmetsp:Transcript_59296/g.94125  ORF Transcript_59296/g.94125 Transcript_59296/m.94125 type:complete len:214 (+) Transcript_59296:67-708(+)|eukprot:CAMPEP_0169111370 /NCGR_PEP_ID=MMETSP1015-20121227/27029_1 /TAXON_ID=342587 /ORGANISM="Karlodinium micrum, Strain CCMP2283" /LENGTH=213 /DNA_ID=CAMNT_0009173263 /DNA_START=65 /DNA_END=706 /DNA_ORIENTATION=+
MATEVPAEDWVTDYVMQFMKSPSWTGPIESFIDDNCKSFDLVDTEENKLEYTAIHNEFKDMVESLLVAHLLDVDVTPDQFASILERAVLAVKEPDSNLDQIVTQIVSVGDFLVFRRMMTSRFVQQQQEVAACLQPALTEQTVSQVEVQNVPSASIPSYQAPRSVAGTTRANRIASIIQSAGQEKPGNEEKAAIIRMAISQSSGRMKAIQRAGA